MKRIANLLLVWGVVALMSSVPQTAAGQDTPPPDFLVTVESAHDFDATLAALKQAIEGENLMVVNEVNPQQMLRMVGVRTGGMRQVFFFHPRYMKRIIETNRNGGMEPPLKILVMEMPNGQVMVRYHDPVHQFAPYGGLSEIATELRGAVEKIVNSVRQ
ncbi:MAG TPA: DUF302 domain-containing protein [Gemmatimonadales bacterium]